MRGISAALAALILAGPAWAEQPGDRFRVTPDDMPAPYATQSVANSARTVSRQDRQPKAPAGFAVTLFAESLDHPRKLLAAPGGGVFVAESRAGKVTFLKDEDGDGRADTRRTVADGLQRPHGMALRNGRLYIADLQRVWSAPWDPEAGALGALTPASAAGSLGSPSGHWTRNIVFSPDGGTLYAAIGSRGNVAEEPAPRATIQAFDVREDGTLANRRTYAAGLRNPVGIRIRPGTDDLYAVVNERDGLGDGLVPDYFTRVEEGAFYGWPYAYIGGNPMPGYADRRPDLVAKSIVPDVLIESHSAPLGLVFLDAADVPPDWRDDALVTLHGSWNANVPTGYKVVRIPFEDGRPTGSYVNFLTHFRVDRDDIGTPGAASVWGRPMGAAVLADGAILIGDDAGRTIWYIRRQEK